MPSASVVIPAYNAAAFVERTLESIRAQTYPAWEVVVVDDGSVDGTADVVDAWIARHGVDGRCLRQSNSKIAAARNAGMRAARGEYIALLDHDDVWYPDKLTVVMREFARDRGLVLVNHDWNICRDGSVVRVFRRGRGRRRMYQRLLFEGNQLSPSTAVFRRDAALAIGGFREDPDLNTVEDYDFWIRLSRGGRFRLIDDVLGEYTLAARGASRRVEYHHANLERMLRAHFAEYFGGRPGWLGPLRIRRRLSAVYRSALSELMAQGAPPDVQRRYLGRMLRQWPCGLRNLARAAAWVASAGMRKAAAKCHNPAGRRT